MLLLAFPELKPEEGKVSEAQKSMDANEQQIQPWQKLLDYDLIEPLED